jgi:hypothetical protein
MKISTIIAFSLVCTALVPAVARADAQQDQQACMNDAMTICGQFIPDRERVAACLISNRTKVSEACRMALNNFDPKAAPKTGAKTAAKSTAHTAAR